METQKENLVICDYCEEEFEIKLKERKHPKGIIETYFNCPHCKEKYISFVTDVKARQLQAEMNKLRDKFYSIQKELYKRSNRLKGKITDASK